MTDLARLKQLLAAATQAEWESVPWYVQGRKAYARR